MSDARYGPSRAVSRTLTKTLSSISKLSLPLVRLRKGHPGVHGQNRDTLQRISCRKAEPRPARGQSIDRKRGRKPRDQLSPRIGSALGMRGSSSCECVLLCIPRRRLALWGTRFRRLALDVLSLRGAVKEAPFNLPRCTGGKILLQA